MRIAHLVDEPYDSGIAHYALAAARGLRDAGHDVEVWGRPGLFPLQEAQRAGLRTRPIAGIADLWSVRKAIRLRGIELLNAHTGSSHTLAVALAQSTPRGPRVVRTRADARPVKLNPGGRVLWARTAGFIAPTERILGEFRQVYPKARCPSAAVYPGFDSPGAAPEPRGAWRVGMVARLDPVKGHEDFLRAAALAAQRFPEAQFAVAGREENVRKGQLEALVSNLGLRGRVEVLGHVEDALAFMASCHIGVIASTGSEAVSRVAVEWMSLGRPLIATSVGCLAEFADQGRSASLVPPGDPRALGAALTALLGDPAERRALGRRARERFEAAFALPRFVRETEGFYNRLLADRDSLRARA
ncbi:MAG: glycosyltransferase family 4 protein [Elusimicrobia bacterium]|nr:glycosyltransferase family 4 protein [Elusimicrobiota bacterium]